MRSAAFVHTLWPLFILTYCRGREKSNLARKRFIQAPARLRDFALLLDVFFPSIYRIFRASHNANRWRIINLMFANSMPVDAGVKKYR